MFATNLIRRALAGSMASLMFTNLFLVNTAHAAANEAARREPTLGSWGGGDQTFGQFMGAPLPAPSPDAPTGAQVSSRIQLRDGKKFELRADPEDAPRHVKERLSEAKREGLWSRIKTFMKEDWRQTKEDFRAVGKWFTKPIGRFKIGWRKVREKLRSFRRKLFHGTKVMALSLLGKELTDEEAQVHMLLTLYIQENGVEDLLEALDVSDDSKLEQLSLAARKVEDPVLRSQLLQRYVAREYLRMRKDLEDKDPQQVARAIMEAEEAAAHQEISDPNPIEWKQPDEHAPAPVYQPYYPFVNAPSGTQFQPGAGSVVAGKSGKRGISLKKVLITLVGGAGLLLAGYFAFATMTITPFLAFIATFVSFLAATRQMGFGQRVVVVQAPPGSSWQPGGAPQPFQGPWPEQPPIEEPPPLVEVPDDLPPLPNPPGGGGGQDPLPDPDPIPVPSTASTGRLDLNRADVEMLQELPGVGPVLAHRIVEARERRRFSGAADVLAVKGLGKAKLKAMLPYVKL